MMGQAVGQQDRLFYEFNLDERFSSDHLLRRIDAVLDLNWLRGELKPYYSHTGWTRFGNFPLLANTKFIAA